MLFELILAVSHVPVKSDLESKAKLVQHSATISTSCLYHPLSSKTNTKHFVGSKDFRFHIIFQPFLLPCTLRSHGPSGVCGPLHFVPSRLYKTPLVSPFPAYPRGPRPSFLMGGPSVQRFSGISRGTYSPFIPLVTHTGLRPLVSGI
jgi:hypothetical protein